MQQNVSGKDKFERVEFDANGIKDVDQTDGTPATPKLAIKTNTGQSLEFKLTGDSKEYVALANWAATTAQELAAQGR